MEPDISSFVKRDHRSSVIRTIGRLRGVFSPEFSLFRDERIIMYLLTGIILVKYKLVTSMCRVSIVLSVHHDILTLGLLFYSLHYLLWFLLCAHFIKISLEKHSRIYCIKANNNLGDFIQIFKLFDGTPQDRRTLQDNNFFNYIFLPLAVVHYDHVYHKCHSDRHSN